MSLQSSSESLVSESLRSWSNTWEVEGMVEAAIEDVPLLLGVSGTEVAVISSSRICMSSAVILDAVLEWSMMVDGSSDGILSSGVSPIMEASVLTEVCVDSLFFGRFLKSCILGGNTWFKASSSIICCTVFCGLDDLTILFGRTSKSVGLLTN